MTIRQRDNDHHEHSSSSQHPSGMLHTLQEALHPICAGYIAGSCGILVGHPLDSLKILLQTATTKTLPSTSQISPLPKRSLRSFYAGISVPLMTVGILQSLNFGMYDSFRKQFYHSHNQHNNDIHDYRTQDSLSNVILSASLAGAILSIFTSPLMVIKTKQQLQVWSMKDAARDTWKRSGGIRNFYTGYIPHLMCESFGRGVYMGTYEYLKRRPSNNDPKELTMSDRMVYAGMSGMACWTLIFPMDVLRSKQYAAAISNTNLNGGATDGIWHMGKDMWKKEGIRSFFRGFGVTILRAGPVAAAVLPMYDLVLDWLQGI